MNTTQGAHTRWVRLLARRLRAEVVETHISWVLLAPERAYKIKKPLRLPFVDYSTAALRRYWCEEEVRLNARLAPDLYEGVSRITGSASKPTLDGQGEAFEHAVRMRRFAPGTLFSERLSAGTLGVAEVDAFAARLAQFHRTASPSHLPFDDGAAQRLARGAWIGARAHLPDDGAGILDQWIAREANELAPLRQARHAAGHVRDGHGDLHLANIVCLPAGVAAFDCIEFDAAMRCIDVVDDACFALMDFAAHGRADLGWRFFNAWLDGTGEHEGVPLLRFGLVYRALVRSQVEGLRERGDAARRYASTAIAFAQGRAPRLTITHGLPGSGKTHASQALLQAQGAIRIRTDVERKRLFGLSALDRSADLRLDIYTADATRRTYERTYALARIALEAGWPVVIDGAFLRRSERDAARQIAREARVPFGIRACTASDALLRQRLKDRQDDASEADESVLARLAAAAQPLQADETADVLPGGLATPSP